MDGHQAAKAIRALGIERSDSVTIPIIALSANAFIDDIQESLDSGCLLYTSSYSFKTKNERRNYYDQ